MEALFELPEQPPTAPAPLPPMRGDLILPDLFGDETVQRRKPRAARPVAPRPVVQPLAMFPSPKCDEVHDGDALWEYRVV